MGYLIDTGVLLRLVDARDPNHAIVLAAIATLGDREEALFISTQNAAEFCNVITRPASANGLGLPPADAVQFLQRDIETICDILIEPEALYDELKRLISLYAVIGKQVHDARLVAMMLVWKIDSVLTLNDRDFRRYEPEGIQIVTPASLASAS